MYATLSLPVTGPAITLQRANAQDGNDGMNAMSSASVESADLLQGRKTVEIKHNGSIYRLQATKLGKLILTK